MSSSTEFSRSIHYVSSTSDDSNTSVTFRVRLFHDYKHTAWLPKLTGLDHTAQWILISTADGRKYKVRIVDNGDNFLLQRGWELLAAIENLQEGQKLIFQIEATTKLTMTICSPPNQPAPIGLLLERIPPTIDVNDIENIVVNQGTTRNAQVDQAICKVWNASSVDSPIYVCRLLISSSEGNFLIFNKKFSDSVPKEKASVAMRFIDSDMIIPGAIKTYKDGCARMVKEWPLYAKAHGLTFGETFVCKIDRGPAIWEFIGCCANH